MRPQIVLFGDSVTGQSFSSGGWGSVLADAYSLKADVVVRDFDGYNTRWALSLLQRIFPLGSSTAPVATVVSFGANDAALSGLQHVPVSEYKDNLRKIVMHFKTTSPTMLIVLVTPPPIDETRYGQFEPERTNNTTGTYAHHCRTLAQELNLPCVDLWGKIQETNHWQGKYLSDGFNLTTQGNQVLCQEILRVFEESLLSPKLMPFDFPHHSTFSEKNTIVWWDYENAGVPFDLPSEKAYELIVQGLRDRGGCYGPVNINLVVAFQNSKLPSALDKRIKIIYAKKYNKPHDIEIKNSQISDKKIKKLVRKWISKKNEPHNTVLIAGDNGYKKLLRELSQDNHTTMVVFPKTKGQKFSSRQLVGKYRWTWRSLLKLDEDVVRGRKVMKRKRGVRGGRKSNKKRRIRRAEEKEEMD